MSTAPLRPAPSSRSIPDTATAARPSPSATTSRREPESEDPMRPWPGSPYPLGATYDGAGTNFAIFSEVAERVELCLFDDDGTETRVALREVDGFVWHGYLPDVEPGPALRLPGPRPVRPRHGPALQPEQAAARPVRQGDRRRDRLGPGRVRLPRSATRTSATTTTRRRIVPKSRRRQPVLRLGRRPPPAHPVPRDGDLRGARQGPHRASTRTSPRSCAAPTPASPTRSMIEHLQQLGVTAVELMPVHQFVTTTACSRRA